MKHCIAKLADVRPCHVQAWLDVNATADTATIRYNFRLVTSAPVLGQREFLDSARWSPSVSSDIALRAYRAILNEDGPTGLLGDKEEAAWMGLLYRWCSTRDVKSIADLTNRTLPVMSMYALPPRATTLSITRTSSQNVSEQARIFVRMAGPNPDNMDPRVNPLMTFPGQGEELVLSDFTDPTPLVLGSAPGTGIDTLTVRPATYLR